jgi:hypothetical protein
VGEHHRRIAEALESVERGDIDRLMIFAPPRHTKSELASRRFPAWYLGRHPEKQLIAATYSGEFALDFGRDVRGIVQDERFSKLFPDVSLAADSQAANRWHTNHGGVSVYVGVGGSITGRGAHIALIDDPFKNREEADSENNRESVWRWYTSTLRTRLMPGGAIIVILTRWHESDLAGMLLERQGRKPEGQWHVIEMPAIRNEGTEQESALWPQWYDLESLKRIKSDIGPREWSALFQQNPRPEEGTFFKREWFEFYTKPPERLNKFATGDFAVTEGDGDFTDIGTHGYAPEGILYLGLDGWYGQTSSDKWIEALIDQFARHHPYCFFAESGVIRRSLEPFLRRRMIERKTHCRLEWLATSADKPSMARPLQAMASMKRVRLPDNEYGHRLLNQFLSFPAGKHDDAVDMAGLMARAIALAHPAIASVSNPTLQPKDSWARAFDEPERGAWRTT